MIALGRMVLMLLAFLTVVYVCLSLYSRSVRRKKLEEAWHTEGHSGDKEAFVRAGLEEYDGSIRRKLILGVYVVPITLIGVLIYVTNFM
ncbi:hypothetical protein [Thalassococcus sp. S3]|uniref:hypothetical protein n=1 Tax=Thalassococcus sp. S3 TaxID=2017482 RepID=UPI0010244462|nr:hypothetical protein [Thalassococcus sp. S3]QBF33163.1 hypothetical protein CFI11_18310 [Thalassococcus sp. S3]